MNEIFGKTSGFKASILERLNDLYSNQIRTNEVVSTEFTEILCETAIFVGNMVGVLVDRKGHVSHVVVGENNRLYLPEIGRQRAGKSRLRGLRLIVAKPVRKHYSQVANPSKIMSKSLYEIDADFILDLEKLQLDLVLQIEVLPSGKPSRAVMACLSSNEVLINGEVIRHNLEHFSNVSKLQEEFSVLIADLEKQLEKKTSQKALIPGVRDSVVLVGVYTESKKKWQPSLDELTELARTAQANVVDIIVQQRKKLDPKTIVGKGKLEEICLTALHKGADVIIFDLDLSPSQLNAITDLTDLKVLDRTMLILDIFAKRAISRSGKMQVDLAQLKYSLPRLAKKQSGLSRLTGGIGGQGPGETKLEVDRRRAKDKIARLEKEIIQLGKQRQLRRKKRNANDVPIIAIVGYTNAGKSTLLNALTGADAYVKNELFATLDPTSRRLRFPEEREVVLIDTVGFIRDLPEGLIDAFRTTLEELHDADLLLHVVDANDPQKEQHIAVVEKILTELELDEPFKQLVINKCDLLPPEEILALSNALNALPVSAKLSTGLEDLLKQCTYHLWQAKGR
ncbi:MAG: GTPase HflX [bacterium]|nr:GTPase HflX [bacterium]